MFIRFIMFNLNTSFLMKIDHFRLSLCCIVFRLLNVIFFVQELNGAPVIPENFPGWTETMNSWGYKMIAATEVTHHLAWFSSLIMLFYACLILLCIQFFFFFFRL